MTLRHLRIFVAVADCGKMRAAAEQLHISQPSVSQAIHELENYYDIKLFDRLSKRIYITEKGSRLLTYARHITDSFDKMEEYVHTASKQSVIRIGASVSVGTCLLPKLLSQLKEVIQDIDIRVCVNNTSTIEAMILDSSIDVAIVEGSVQNPDLVQTAIADDELVLVAGALHPLFQRKKLSLNELSKQKLISREHGSAERNQFEQFLAEEGVQVKNTWVCSNTETIKQALHMGEGLAILSKMLVESEIEYGQFHIIELEDIHIYRKLKLIYHPNKYISQEMNSFIKLCLDKCANQ